MRREPAGIAPASDRDQTAGEAAEDWAKRRPHNLIYCNKAKQSWIRKEA